MWYIIHSPLEQFDIKEYINIELLSNIVIPITTIAFYLGLAYIIVIQFSFLGQYYVKILSNKWVTVKDSVYDTVLGIVRSQINSTYGELYFPMIFVLFTFILSSNLIGMVPYSFAATSHFILTFALSFTIVTGATILSFRQHGTKFFSIFVPVGCPKALLPLLVLIEFISYLSRLISLGLRLGANILAGHMLLHILSGFVYKIMKSSLHTAIFGLLPLFFVLAFSGLELGIAFIQAQVFIVLTSSYIKDGLDLH